MRKLLLLALLLYDIVTFATRPSSYDYEDLDSNKRHSVIDDRRNYRKKLLLKPAEFEHKNMWDDRRHDFDNQRYFDDHPDPKNYRGRELDASGTYHGQRHYDDDRMALGRSAEMGHGYNMDKEPDVKDTNLMNCNRPHERYETCFGGCASITCDNPRERLRPCYPFCEQGCICIHPYVRDDRTHKCVLPEDCSKGLKGIPDLGEDI